MAPFKFLPSIRIVAFFVYFILRQLEKQQINYKILMDDHKDLMQFFFFR